MRFSKCARTLTTPTSLSLSPSSNTEEPTKAHTIVRNEETKIKSPPQVSKERAAHGKLLLAENYFSPRKGEMKEPAVNPEAVKTAGR